MKKALNQWCFPTGTTLMDIFQISNKYGYDGVELNLYNVGEEGITLETSSSELKAIRNQSLAYGVEMKSLSTALYWGTAFTDPDESVQLHARTILERQLEIAHELEMEAILVVPGLVNEQVSYQTAYRRSTENIEKLVPLAEQYGVKIGIENVWNKFLLSPLEMRQYVDQFNSNFVGVYFDVGNVLQYGYPEHWIEVLREKIVKVHVKDFSTAVGNITGFVPLLAGDVAWESVAKSLTAIGYNDYVTVEVSPYFEHSELLAKHSKNALDAIFR